MGERDDYKYLDIRDAVASINQKVNIIGVILEIGLRKPTKGTDFFCMLKIIDKSHQKPAISVNVFAEDLEKLPQVASAGDIILLSHVVMKTHAGEVYAVFNKKLSSFALYEGKDGKDFLPYQVSSKYRPRELDKRFISSLREWMVNFQLDEGSSNFLWLREMKLGEREMKEGGHVNLLCKIVHICDDAKNGWMALIWDGSDAPPLSIPSKLEDEMDNMIPLQYEPLSSSRDLLCSIPPLGTTLSLIFEQGMEKNSLHMLNTGKWVKLVNVLFEVQSGVWRVVLTAFSKLRYTSVEDHLVLERIRLYDERLSSRLGWIPFWSFPGPSYITEVDYKRPPFVSLMQVLTYSEVTAKFKCLVRVVAIYPCRSEDFRSPSGTYRMRLTLEDPTARIHAYVYAEDGEKFFGGHPSIDELTRKRNKLLGVTTSNDGREMTDTPRNPPWVQCCLKSYYLNKDDMWGSRHYRIFGTKIVD